MTQSKNQNTFSLNKEEESHIRYIVSMIRLGYGKDFNFNEKDVQINNTIYNKFFISSGALDETIKNPHKNIIKALHATFPELGGYK